MHIAYDHISGDINLINVNIFFINNFNTNLKIYLYIVIICIYKNASLLYNGNIILELYHVLTVTQSK